MSPLPTQALWGACFLPGFLGVLKTSQSWATSLPTERGPISPMGVSALQHFGVRLGIYL